ncbi:cyclase family protein [Streptomyces sp. MMBL 11-3]|uniref:cyclase family protein n=1 Tax=Streptomyces sp. MMBL 11-3 TaxID=3382639 RepID=UPI0039B4397C
MPTENFPSNWGRWGADDQIGAVNLIGPEARARGVLQVRTGRAVSLARATRSSSLLSIPMLPPGQPAGAVQTAMFYTGADPVAMGELMVLPTHHRDITHLDALSHFVTDGKVYPGVPQPESTTPMGVRHGAADVFADGILTRGVLLDLAPGGSLPDGHAITAGDLAAAAERAGVEVEEGDAIVVRGGWDTVTEFGRPLPGMTADAVRWMHDHGIALYAGDVGDAMPPLDDEVPGALHVLALGRLGIPLIDGADPEALAAACAEQGRHTFMLVVAVPRILGTTGMIVNPLAIF